MNQRQEFLQYFFKGIQQFQYAILKDIYKDIYELPESADIDLVIDKKNLLSVLDMIRKGDHVMHVKAENKGLRFEGLDHEATCGCLNMIWTSWFAITIPKPT